MGPQATSLFPSPTTQIVILAALLMVGLLVNYLRNRNIRSATAPGGLVLTILVTTFSAIAVFLHWWLWTLVLLVIALATLAMACWLFIVTVTSLRHDKRYRRRRRFSGVKFAAAYATAGLCLIHLTSVHAERLPLGLNGFFLDVAYVTYIAAACSLVVLALAWIVGLFRR